MIDMELKIERIRLEKVLEVSKAELKSVLEEMAIRRLDVDESINMLNQIKAGKSDYDMLVIVERLRDDLEEIENRMRYKEAYENKIADIRYKIEHLEDDYIE